MISSILLKTNPEPCSGTSRGFYVEWQGKLYGPYVDDADAFLKDKFRFDGGQPLSNPLDCK